MDKKDVPVINFEKLEFSVPRFIDEYRYDKDGNLEAIVLRRNSDYKKQDKPSKKI